MSDVLSALGGVAVGGLVTYLVTRVLNRRERRLTHGAAVRAVLYELSANLVVATNPTANGTGSTAAYDSLAIAFYSGMPDDVAMVVSAAYATMHTVGLGSRQMAYARVAIGHGQVALLEYAKKSLKLKFPAPPPWAGQPASLST